MDKQTLKIAAGVLGGGLLIVALVLIGLWNAGLI